MAILLSKRVADTSRLQESLQRDPTFAQQFLSRGVFDTTRLEAAVEYITQTYSCSQPDAEEALQHFLRGIQQQRSQGLSNRLAQSNIVIPPTTDHPAGKTIQVEKGPPPPPTPPAKIDTEKAESPNEKIEDLAKPVAKPAENRQQKVIDSIQSVKVAIGELAEAMYSLKLGDEALGKCVGKVIEQVSSACAEQTAATVQHLASPLIGES